MLISASYSERSSSDLFSSLYEHAPLSKFCHAWMRLAESAFCK